MSRKFLDDNIEVKLVLNGGVGFDHLPGVNSTIFDPGHMAVDPISGKRFVNEGPNDHSGALFVNDQYNALTLHEKLEQLPATAVAAGKNANIILSGTNVANTTVGFDTIGGVKMTTTTTSGDQVILGGAASSAWGLTFAPDNQIVFETQVVTNSNITAVTLWAGLKLTTTSVTATDNDQTFFRYQDTVNGGRWQVIDSNNNVDNVNDSGVAVAASTSYLLQVKVGVDLKPRYYINGVFVYLGKALRTGTALLPVVGVQTGAAAAKIATCRHLRLAVPRT